MGNAVPAPSAGQSELLKIEQKGAVLTVGLNRPAKRNALNDGIILAIGDCFAHLPEGVGAVVIHVFHHPLREVYDLEGLWVDARRVAIDVPAEARAGQIY